MEKHNFDFKLPKKVKDKWVKALRSGKYRQGSESLKVEPHSSKSGRTEYCCLGVACELGLTKPPGNIPIEEACYVQKSFLPTKIQHFLAIFNDGRLTLDYNPNHEKWGFKKIATWIDHNL
jgi:uncharacterized protein YqkB